MRKNPLPPPAAQVDTTSLREQAAQSGFAHGAIAPALPGKESKRRAAILWIIGLMGFIALVFVVLHVGSIERFIEIARSTRPAWLLLALGVQFGTYLCAALVWHQTLVRAGHPLPLRDLIPLGVAKVFTDQVLPSGGISGTVLVLRGLIRRRVPSSISMAAMLVGLVSNDLAYLLVVVGSMAMLWSQGLARLPLVIGVSLFLIIKLTTITAVLGLKEWDQRKPISWVGRRLGISSLFHNLAMAPLDVVRDPLLLIRGAGLQLGIVLLDACTLWIALDAIGNVPPAWVVFVSFVVASMVFTIGPIPVGLGTFEVAQVSMLHILGVSVEAALAGTIMLRGFTFWLPMLPGMWLARAEIAEK